MPNPTSPATPAATEGIPRPVKGLAAVSLFNDFASEMVYPLLPAFVTGTLGAGATMLGALDGAADLSSAALKWVSGRLADRPGWRRPLILVGYLTAVLVRPLMAVAGAAWQVVGFRVIDRLGKGLRTPPRDALIAEVTPEPLRGRAFGFHRMADHFGSIPGSLLAWWLLSLRVDVRTILAWSFVPGLVAFLVLVPVLRTVRPAGKAPQGARVAKKKASGPSDATGRVFWVPVLLLAALTLFRLPETLLLLRLQDLGVAVAWIPLVWAALHVVRSLASYPGGWLSDHLGPRVTVAAGGLVFAGVAFGLGHALGHEAAIAVFLAYGLVGGLVEAPERSLVARLAPVRTGRGFGAYHAVTGLAALPAALAFGAVYERAGGGTALWTSAALMAVVVMFWLVLAPAGRGTRS